MLQEEFEKTGKWLFRWRSYFPLTLIGVILLGLRHSEGPYHSQMGDELWEIIWPMISLLGVVIRIYTIGYTPRGTSGQNTRRQEAEVLNTTGAYSVVRHPLYLGNFFILLGISMFAGLWWISLISILAFWLYYERIMFAEEAFLRRKFGKEYEEWANKTPAFLPRLKNWKRPQLQ